MHKALIMTAVSASALLATSCAPKEGEAIIERQSVEIVDGNLTPEVLEAMARISEVVPSPDGKKFLYVMTFENLEANKGNSEIYLANIDGSDVKRITKTPSSEGNVRWIENGKRIAFLGHDKATDKTQVFVANPDGSGRHCITSEPRGVMCFEFAPNDSRLVYASSIDANVRANTDRRSELFKGLDNTTGRLVDDLMYKHWDEWVEDYPHPFIADFDGTEISNVKDIMKGEPYECPMKPFGGAESFAWTPDGKKLVYVSRKLTGKEYAYSTDSGLYLYDVESGKTELITKDMPGYDTNPAFSPDGKTLAWLSMATAKFESDKKRLMTMDMTSGKMTDLTQNWDRWPEDFAWAPDGKKIVFTGYNNGTEPIFSIDPKSAAIDTLASGVYDYQNASMLPDGRVLALRHSMLVPNDVVIVEGKKVTQLTDENKEILSKLNEPKVEKVLVPTTDGKEMTTWVVLPPNFDPNKKYPAILYCQGGPQQAVSQIWSYRWNFRIMAQNGYVVICPNRRGLPGFGEEWNRQISGDYSGQNIQDYLAAVDYMREKPYIDADHIGAIGASYGGYSVYYLAGHHEGRFAALIAHAGIFNLEAQYLETEEMWFADFDLGGYPWDKANAVAQRTFANSPHLAVDKWTAPILVTVGELDYRILASQGMMAFNAAKMRGLEAEMLVFPDENHWILKPQNAVLWQRVFFDFLDRYLKNGAKPAAAPQASPAADSAVSTDSAK